MATRGFVEEDDAPNVVPWGPQYDPLAPDAAPSVTPWGFVQPPDPYSAEALSSVPVPPSQDYYRRDVMAERLGGSEGRAAALLQMIDLGGPARSAAIGILQGNNPAEQTDPWAVRGIDTPGIRSLPDNGPQFGPVHITPRTVAGFALEAATDPSSYLGLRAAGPAGQLVSGAGKVASEAAGPALKAAGRGAQMLHADEAGAINFGRKNIPPNLSQLVPAQITPPARVLKDVFGIDIPNTVLTKEQKFENAARRLVGADPLNHPQATAIFEDMTRWHERASFVANVERESMRDALSKAFRYDGKWQITSLANKVKEWPDGPTTGDLLAHRPQFDAFLTPEQRIVLDAIDVKAKHYEAAARASNPDLGVRADVEPGGTYFHRVYERPPETRIRASKGKAGGKENYERVADVASDASAIRGGRQPAAPWEAFGQYVNEVGDSAANEYAAALSRELLDPKTAAGRVPPALRAKWDKLNSTISGARKTMDAQYVRLKSQADDVQRATRATRDAIGDLADSSVSRGEQRALYNITPDDVALSRSAVDASVSSGRTLSRDIGTNAEKLRAAGRTLSAQEQALLKQADELDTLIMQAEGLRGGADRAADTALAAAEGVEPNPFLGGASGQAKGEARLLAEGADSLHREYLSSVSAADAVEAKIQKMADAAERMSRHVDALTVRGEILGNMDAAARGEYVAARQHERAIADMVRRQAVADREVGLLERAAQRAGAAEKAALGRATNQATRTVRTQRLYDAAVKRKNSLSDQWKEAVELSRRLPEGRGEIDLTELSGTDFPLSVANAANRVIRRANRDPGAIEEVVLMFNNLYRSTTSTLDNSWIGNQGTLAAVKSPRAVARASYANARAWMAGGDKALGEAINSFNTRAATEGMPPAQHWASRGVLVTANDPEFVLNTGLAAKLKNAPIVRHANRAFGTQGSVARIGWAQAELADEMAKTGKTWQQLDDEGALRQIADIVNNGTGYSGRKFGGEAADYLLYAGRYLEARIETLARAAQGSIPARGLLSNVTPLSPEAPLAAKIARRSILRAVGVFTTLTIAANAAQGKETDFRLYVPDGKGGKKYNNKFMKAEIGDRVVTMPGFGTYMSIVRAMALTADGHPEDAYRSLSSGAVRDAWNVIEHGFGRGYRSKMDPGEFAVSIMAEHLPFSAQGMGPAIGDIAGGDVVPGAIAAGYSFLGGSQYEPSAPSTGSASSPQRLSPQGLPQQRLRPQRLAPAR